MMVVVVVMMSGGFGDNGFGCGGDYAKITKAPRLIALPAQNAQCASLS